jgi:hypothetical protein
MLEMFLTLRQSINKISNHRLYIYIYIYIYITLNQISAQGQSFKSTLIASQNVKKASKFM